MNISCTSLLSWSAIKSYKPAAEVCLRLNNRTDSTLERHVRLILPSEGLLLMAHPSA